MRCYRAWVGYYKVRSARNRLAGWLDTDRWLGLGGGFVAVVFAKVFGCVVYTTLRGGSIKDRRLSLWLGRWNTYLRVRLIGRYGRVGCIIRYQPRMGCLLSRVNWTLCYDLRLFAMGWWYRWKKVCHAWFCLYVDLSLVLLVYALRWFWQTRRCHGSVGFSPVGVVGLMDCTQALKNYIVLIYLALAVVLRKM